MSTPVQHKASAGDKAPTLRCVKPAEPALPDAAGLMPFNSWRMETIEQLQSTLILRSQLCLFLDQMEKIVAIDGIHYRNEEEGVDLEINRQSSHSCGYRLITDTGYVGELVFTREEMFSESELTALETSLSLLLNPLRNALRYRRAVDAAQKDPVTGSNTRDSMHETLAREIDLAKRHNQPLSVMMLSIGQLPEIQQLHGREAADRIRMDVVHRTRNVCRGTDVVFSVDQDWFLLLLNHADAEQALKVRSRLVQQMRSARQARSQSCLQFPLRLGLATLTGTDSLDSLIERANRSSECRDGSKPEGVLLSCTLSDS